MAKCPMRTPSTISGPPEPPLRLSPLLKYANGKPIPPKGVLVSNITPSIHPSGRPSRPLRSNPEKSSSASSARRTTSRIMSMPAVMAVSSPREMAHPGNRSAGSGQVS